MMGQSPPSMIFGMVRMMTLYPTVTEPKYLQMVSIDTLQNTIMMPRYNFRPYDMLHKNRVIDNNTCFRQKETFKVVMVRKPKNLNSKIVESISK